MSRPSDAATVRRRWSLTLGNAEDLVWPDPAPPQTETLFDALVAVGGGTPPK